MIDVGARFKRGIRIFPYLRCSVIYCSNITLCETRAPLKGKGPLLGRFSIWLGVVGIHLHVFHASYMVFLVDWCLVHNSVSHLSDSYIGESKKSSQNAT
jgi:hypothetical protein